jgi:hypothetical protein
MNQGDAVQLSPPEVEAVSDGEPGRPGGCRAMRSADRRSRPLAPGTA